MQKEDGGFEQEDETYVSWSSKLIKNVVARSIRVSGNVPRHIGFVMDGNRRYARKKDIEIKEGHEAGFVSMSKILELCYESGVESTTVFAFSIENFKRSAKEVNNLMDLAKQRIKQICSNKELARKYGVRINVVGHLRLLSKDTLDVVQEAMDATKDNNRATLNICFPYTGREEILHSIRENVAAAANNHNAEKEVSIDSHLYMAGQPPLDLLIRTSGVLRLSDFMLWEAVGQNVVIEFVDSLWPEFNTARMAWILLKFAFQRSFSPRGWMREEDDDVD